MMRRLALLATILVTILVAACHDDAAPSSVTPLSNGPPPVILISIDGFRPDYLHRGDTPTLDHLAETGVSGAMRPAFPSVTFPNHTTLVTGLTPDHHGIVGNTMHDPAIPGETFSVGKRTGLNDPRWWAGSEPVWITAEAHGLRTATMFWPGSDVPFHGLRPHDWRIFDPQVTPQERVDQVLAWFRRPGNARPAFTTLYFDGVDHAGHKYGPDSAAVRRAARKVDDAIGALVAGLSDEGVTPDLIIVSDHGMTAISPKRVIPLTDLAPADDMEIVTSGAYAGLDPRPGRDHALAAALARPHAHVQCWPKSRIPARFAYGQNPRVPAFLCLAQTGWMLTAPGAHPPSGGTHGYDNADPAMAALFIGHGPAFASDKTIPEFDNVDIYPLTMELLGLMPLPDDGTVTPFAPYLRGVYANF